MAKRTQNDHYAMLAKRKGYPARSVFKLEEILQKYPLIKKNDLVLDLGAAPGSFSLYLAKKIEARVVACDLKPLQVQHPEIHMIQGDFTHAEILKKIGCYGLYNAVISDAAPATTGDRLVDGARSLALVEQAWKISGSFLMPQGVFMAKVFEHGDERDFMKKLDSYFDVVKAVRPKAIRSESMEFYILGIGYKILEKKNDE
ncbi:MAG: SAM-dependent methyltransferase [Spirochaetia bacterium]